MHNNELVAIRCKGAEDYYSMFQAGYYANSTENGTFYWDKESYRSVIKINACTLSKSAKLLKECKLPCTYTFCRNSSTVLDILEDFKPKKWFSPFVRTIYEELLQAKLAFTIEAFYNDRIVGGLFGISLGSILTVDTMVGLPESKHYRSTSKAALCHLILNGFKQGITWIDDQVQHPSNHPAARLGEERINFIEFKKHLYSNLEKRNEFVVNNFGTIFMCNI